MPRIDLHFPRIIALFVLGGIILGPLVALNTVDVGPFFPAYSQNPHVIAQDIDALTLRPWERHAEALKNLVAFHYLHEIPQRALPSMMGVDEVHPYYISQSLIRELRLLKNATNTFKNNPPK